MDLWNVKQVYRLYEDSGETTDLTHSYLQDEQRVATSLKYYFQDNLALDLQVSYHQNRYGNDLLSDEEKEASLALELPEKSNHNKYGFAF